jgi:hypothetical protein
VGVPPAFLIDHAALWLRPRVGPVEKEGRLSRVVDHALSIDGRRLRLLAGFSSYRVPDS